MVGPKAYSFLTRLTCFEALFWRPAPAKSSGNTPRWPLIRFSMAHALSSKTLRCKWLCDAM